MTSGTVPRDNPTTLSLLEELATKINAGDCVAFVGAGFCQPGGLPSWNELLDSALAEAPARARALAQALQEGHKPEAAAQVLRDEMGEAFVEVLQRRLDRRPSRALAPRTKLLKGIPFRAVLTTNFDTVFDGVTAGPAAYREILRPQDHRWWSESRYWQGEAGPTLLKIHGDVRDGASLVFSVQDYRRRIHLSPGYLSFLRALMSTSTFLYLGCSFSDHYLNELRSEALALVGHVGHATPLAYAFDENPSKEEMRYYREHEGLALIPCGKGFARFDENLRALHALTNPRARMGHLLAERMRGGRRILWVDPNPQNNTFAVAFLANALLGNRGRSSPLVDNVPTAGEALKRLRARPGGYHLVVSHWGESDKRPVPTAVQLLTKMPRSEDGPPVVIFASERDAEARRRRALGLGAVDYHFTFAGLLRCLERLFLGARDVG